LGDANLKGFKITMENRGATEQTLYYQIDYASAPCPRTPPTSTRSSAAVNPPSTSRSTPSSTE
jgi:hypothetical protein